MYSCPACGASAVARRSRCVCGADLSLLVSLDGLCDTWFNSALTALAAGATGRALEWFAACAAARPSDGAALRALARVWAQLGHHREAGEALERAAAIEPDAPDVAVIRKALADAAACARAPITAPSDGQGQSPRASKRNRRRRS